MALSATHQEVRAVAGETTLAAVSAVICARKTKKRWRSVEICGYLWISVITVVQMNSISRINFKLFVGIRGVEMGGNREVHEDVKPSSRT